MFRSTLVLALAGAFSLGAAAQALAKPAAPAGAKPAAKPVAKPGARPARPAAAKAPVEVPPPPASPEQKTAAAMAHLGDYACEFGQTVTVLASPQYEGYLDVRLKGVGWVMKPVLSSTGALRLEDTKQRMLMIQIANKSMLMDTQIGQRLVDGCQHATQVEFARTFQPQVLLMTPEQAAAAASAATAAASAAATAATAATAAATAASAAATAASAAAAVANPAQGATKP
jgi:hypothetical protein